MLRINMLHSYFYTSYPLELAREYKLYLARYNIHPIDSFPECSTRVHNLPEVVLSVRRGPQWNQLWSDSPVFSKAPILTPRRRKAFVSLCPNSIHQLKQYLEIGIP